MVGLLSGTMHAKSKTIFHLIGNLICYMVVIAVIYIVCKTLGFDTTTIIASVGSLSLAISMASKDIIADVLAGILLVFSIGDSKVVGA